jgi:hypothetical protein
VSSTAQPLELELTGRSRRDRDGLERPAGGWFDGGGTSLAAPLVAAFQAITGVNGSTPQWAYADAANLNDPSAGSTGACAGQSLVLCNAAEGYDGPTGAGSISGQLATGAPGIGLPSFGAVNAKTYTRRVTKTARRCLAVSLGTGCRRGRLGSRFSIRG